MQVPSLLLSSTAAQRQSAMHAAWQSAALVPAPSTAYGVSAHDMFCIATMLAVAPEPAVAQSPAPVVSVHPSGALAVSMKLNPGGHRQSGCASRPRTQ